MFVQKPLRKLRKQQESYNVNDYKKNEKKTLLRCGQNKQKSTKIVFVKDIKVKFIPKFMNLEFLNTNPCDN